MPKNDDFAKYIIEDVLREVPEIASKYMFGSYCLFAHGRIFAIINKDVVYFKADAETSKAYRNAGSRQFTYRSKNGTVKMDYWQVPDEVMEDSRLAAEWASKSIAIKSKSKKK